MVVRPARERRFNIGFVQASVNQAMISSGVSVEEFLEALRPLTAPPQPKRIMLPRAIVIRPPWWCRVHRFLAMIFGGE